MTDSNPLSQLLTTESQKSLDLQKIAAALKKLVLIDSNDKTFHFLPAFQQLEGNNLKIQVLLIASKARSLLFDDDEKIVDGLTPKELIQFEVMPEGSVKSALRKLNSESLIKKAKSGVYYIPGYLVNDVLSLLG